MLRHLAAVACVKLEVAGVEYVDYPQLTATQRAAFRLLKVDVALKDGRK